MPTVFWSWQSDVSPRETRNLFREALVEAIQRVASDFEEAERPELDQDTRGVPGSPEIVATIFRKIDTAGVFVADVTPIAVSGTGKHLPNPNVLIELGYAKKALSPDRVILVWNTAVHGSRPEDLPFDMRHRRAPLGVSISVGADRTVLREQRRALTDQLEDALRASLAVVPPAPVPVVQWKESVSQNCVWPENSSGLPVNTSDNTPDVIVEGDQLGFARLIPSTWTPRSDALEVLRSPQVGPPLLGRHAASNWGPTRAGFLVFRHSNQTSEDGLTSTATRWYRDTGELWGVDGNFLRDRGEDILYAEPYAVGRWTSWVRHAADCCRILGGSGIFTVRLGIDDLTGAKWARNYDVEFSPRALEASVEHTFELPVNPEPDSIYVNVMHTANLVRSAFGFPHMSQRQFSEMLAQAGY